MPTWVGDKFLDQFIDPEIAVDHSWTPDKERSEQLTRLTHACAVTMLCRDWSGRLNESDHTRSERSEDKKLARKVTSRLLVGIKTWGGDEQMVIDYLEANTEKIRREAAAFDWKIFWEKHRVQVSNCLRHVATQAKSNSYITDGNRFCNALVNEYRSLDDVLGLLLTSEE
jgi:hypothetical protein